MRERGASEHKLQRENDKKHTSGLLGGNCCMIVELSRVFFGLFSFFCVYFFQCYRIKLYVGIGIHSTQQDDVVRHTHTDRYERNHKVDIVITWILHRHICYIWYT